MTSGLRNLPGVSTPFHSSLFPDWDFGVFSFTICSLISCSHIKYYSFLLGHIFYLLEYVTQPSEKLGFPKKKKGGTGNPVMIFKFQ